MGRKAPAAANATNTEFKFRAISVPNQSIVASTHNEKGTPLLSGGTDDGVATTQRMLSLLDLCAQLQHYSAKVRRDAYMGLLELATNHPSAVRKEMGTFLR